MEIEVVILEVNKIEMVKKLISFGAKKFFDEEFSTAVPFMPTLLDDFFHNVLKGDNTDELIVFITDDGKVSL